MIERLTIAHQACGRLGILNDNIEDRFYGAVANFLKSIEKVLNVM